MHLVECSPAPTPDFSHALRAPPLRNREAQAVWAAMVLASPLQPTVHTACPAGVPIPSVGPAALPKWASTLQVVTQPQLTPRYSNAPQALQHSGASRHVLTVQAATVRLTAVSASPAGVPVAPTPRVAAVPLWTSGPQEVQSSSLTLPSATVLRELPPPWSLVASRQALIMMTRAIADFASLDFAHPPVVSATSGASRPKNVNMLLVVLSLIHLQCVSGVRRVTPHPSQL